jgi:hypothetical protein
VFVELIQPLPAKFANQQVFFYLAQTRFVKNTFTVFGQPFCRNVVVWHSRSTRELRTQDEHLRRSSQYINQNVILCCCKSLAHVRGGWLPAKADLQF